MKLYLVRHGESVANITDLYHFPDTPLSEEGLRQSKTMAQRVSKLPVDLIYSSDLLRAQQTAMSISEKIGKEVEFTPLLREFRKPSKLWGKSDDYEHSKAYVKLQKQNFSNPDWKWEDDESFNDLKSRAMEILKELSTKYTDKQIVVVSHGGIIKMMTAVAVIGKELTPQVFWNFWHNLWIKNTGITVLEFKNDKWTLITWNDISHFGE
jgi:broad specificity phosphatase PhoE